MWVYGIGWCMEQYCLRCGESIRYFTTPIQTKLYVRMVVYILKKFVSIQILKTGHLVCVVACIIGGVVLLLAESIVVATNNNPMLVNDPVHDEQKIVCSCRV